MRSKGEYFEDDHTQQKSYVCVCVCVFFIDQSGYSIVRPRTDDVPAERLVSYTSGDSSLLK